MNVIVANTRQEELSTLDVDIIKSVTGVYEVDELVSMFQSFFFSKMILDVTALNNYLDANNIQKLAMGLDPNKLILLLPNDAEASSSGYLSKLISMGIYNFTNNIPGIKYLLVKPNSYKDVAHIQQLGSLANTVVTKVSAGSRIIGVKNITDNAGATTLIYAMKKNLEMTFGKTIYAVEAGKQDFQYFNDENMLSVLDAELPETINKLTEAKIILVDLNGYSGPNPCEDMIYLVEPSTIKLNKLMRKDKNIFQAIAGQKIILMKSLLSPKDVKAFEREAGIEVFFNMPPINEREKSVEVQELLANMGLAKPTGAPKEGSTSGLLGRFKF